MIYLGLGSNLGDREKNLRQAFSALKGLPRINVIKASSIYETAPIGYTDQPDFLNAVIAIDTNLSPWQLLDVCLTVEAAGGRIRKDKWGPRTVDIDILLYNDEQISCDRLILPHPRLSERCFVLIPLMEIAPKTLVLKGATLQELVTKCPAAAVRLFKPFN